MQREPEADEALRGEAGAAEDLSRRAPDPGATCNADFMAGLAGANQPSALSTNGYTASIRNLTFLDPQQALPASTVANSAAMPTQTVGAQAQAQAQAAGLGIMQPQNFAQTQVTSGQQGFTSVQQQQVQQQQVQQQQQLPPMPAGSILPSQSAHQLAWSMMSLPQQQQQLAPMLPNNNAAQVPAVLNQFAVEGQQQGLPQIPPQMMLPFLASLQQYMNAWPAAAAAGLPTTTASSVPQPSSMPQLSPFGTFGFPTAAPVPVAQTDTQSQTTSSNNASIFPLNMFSFSTSESQSRSSSSSQGLQSMSNNTTTNGTTDQSVPGAKRRRLSATASFVDGAGTGSIPGVFNSAFPPVFNTMPSMAAAQDAVSAHMLLGGGSRTTTNPNPTNPEQMQPSQPQPPEPQGTRMPLVMPNDKEWLTKKECFLRTHCFELFSATPKDITSNTSGRRNPVIVGQVGIRCIYCSMLPASMRAQRSMCFPSSVRTMQKAFVNLVHLHFPACPEIPDDVRATYDSLKSSHSPMGSNEYRIESMERILDDVEAGGVRFKDGVSASNLPDAPGKVVFGSDRKFVTDLVFLIFGQMQQCTFSSDDGDGVPPGSTHEIGYTGLACMHCSTASMPDGRFFPESPNGIASLHDAGEFYGHISKCSNTPQDVKNRLLEMKGRGDDQKKKLKAGSKKEFFQRVWLRLHKSFNGKVYNSDKCSGSDVACGEW